MHERILSYNYQVAKGGQTANVLPDGPRSQPLDGCAPSENADRVIGAR